MRLGAPIFEKYDSPESWVQGLKKKRYRAAYCPVGPDAEDATIKAYADAAREADIVIAEVGAFGVSPLSSDEKTRRDALQHCKNCLELADKIGARCCVNVAGSRGQNWYGPDKADLTEETFQMIVESVRDIIDSVKPTRTYYTLETMPYLYPDSPDSYVHLIKAIDRERFAAHLDPVNLVSSPQRYYNSGRLIRDCFEKFGPLIKSCHAKDISLRQDLTVRLEEIRPGLGNLDYRVFLRELSKLEADVPLMLEHLPNEEEYDLAAEYVRKIAREEGLSI